MNPTSHIFENSSKEYFIQLTADFNWLITTNEFFDLNRATHDLTETIPLKNGDIVVLKIVDSQNETVVVSTISDDIETQQNVKSVMPWHFIQNNIHPSKGTLQNEFHEKAFIFKDVSDVWSREKKLKDLLNKNKSCI